MLTNTYIGFDPIAAVARSSIEICGVGVLFSTVLSVDWLWLWLEGRSCDGAGDSASFINFPWFVSSIFDMFGQIIRQKKSFESI